MNTNTESEAKSVKHPKLSLALNISLICLSVIALAVAGVLIYQKRYLTPFWVNGQSMYPTLNKDAIKPNGTPYGVDGGSATSGSKNLDYGVMDKHDIALKHLKRFDVIICNYSSSDSSDKIKRIVGLPGETIKFGQGESNGELYVKENDKFTFCEQPLERQYIASGSYPVNEITLGNDEYYVLGDNRSHSSDSRNNPPVKYEWIIGKVIAICGYCEVTTDSSGSLEPINIKHFPPRFL